MVALQEATILTEMLLENAKNYMYQVGSLFPFFILYKNGSPMLIELDYEEVINIQCDDEPELRDIYRSIVYLRMDRDEDAMIIQPLAQHLVETYKPDAIAFIVPSFYKLSTTNLPDEHYNLDKDPEAITILYVTLYLSDIPAGQLKVIPYTSLGEETDSEKIEKGLKYRFNFSDFNWTDTDVSMRGRFENPYNN